MIEIKKIGYASIQDEGRKGLRAIGIPTSGAMDRYMMRMANQLVGNSFGEAVIEFGLVGPKFLVHDRMNVSLVGIGIRVLLNGNEMEDPSFLSLKSGDEMHVFLGESPFNYMGIQGGIQSEEVLGSQSQYTGITSGERLSKGDIIRSNNRAILRQNAKVRFNTDQYKTDQFEVFPGPEWPSLSPITQEEMLTTALEISSFSRMAYTSNISTGASEIISSAVIPGTIQLTPSVQLHILMYDGQTIGGYSRVLQFDEDDLHILAQKNIGQKIYLGLKNLE